MCTLTANYFETHCMWCELCWKALTACETVCSKGNQDLADLCVQCVLQFLIWCIAECIDMRKKIIFSQLPCLLADIIKSFLCSGAGVGCDSSFKSTALQPQPPHVRTSITVPDFTSSTIIKIEPLPAPECRGSLLCYYSAFQQLNALEHTICGVNWPLKVAKNTVWNRPVEL